MLEFTENYGKSRLTNKPTLDIWVPGVSAHCTVPHVSSYQAGFSAALADVFKAFISPTFWKGGK
jgi:hypothetical protein